MEKVDTLTYFKKSKRIDVKYWELFHHVIKVCRSRPNNKNGRQLNSELLLALLQMNIWREQIKESGFSKRLIMEKYKRAYKLIKKEEPDGGPKIPDYMKRDNHNIGVSNYQQ